VSVVRSRIAKIMVVLDGRILTVMLDIRLGCTEFPRNFGNRPPSRVGGMELLSFEGNRSLLAVNGTGS